MSIALSEQEILRRESLQQLRALGINPYPAEEYKVTAFAQDITDNFEKFPDIYKPATISRFKYSSLAIRKNRGISSVL